MNQRQSLNVDLFILHPSSFILSARCPGGLEPTTSTVTASCASRLHHGHSASTRTRTRNALLEARNDVRFTIEASGRRGSRTLTALRPHGLANRPGNPYPAALRIRGQKSEGSEVEVYRGQKFQVIEHDSDLCTLLTFFLDLSSGEWGSNPRSPASKAGGLPLSYPLESGPPGNRTPIYLVAGQAVFPKTAAHQ